MTGSFGKIGAEARTKAAYPFLFKCEPVFGMGESVSDLSNQRYLLIFKFIDQREGEASVDSR